MALVQIWQVDSLKRVVLRNVLDVVAEMKGHFPFDAYHKAFEGEVPAVSNVEEAFFQFNAGTGGHLDAMLERGERPKIYSLSVGDIVIIDGQGWRCASLGWDDVTDALLGRAA